MTCSSASSAAGDADAGADAPGDPLAARGWVTCEPPHAVAMIAAAPTKGEETFLRHLWSLSCDRRHHRLA
jgi:hypothetical protein